MEFVYLYDDMALASRGVVATLGDPSKGDANYLVGNVVNPDRKVKFRTIASPGSSGDYVDVQIDLGVTPSPNIGGIGVHDFQTEDPAGGPTINLFSSSTGFGSLTTLHTNQTGAGFWASSRDWIKVLTSSSHRYWVVRFFHQGFRFSLGKIILGPVSAFPFVYSPGSEFQVVTPATHTTTVDEDLVEFILGRTRKHYRVRYDDVTDAEWAVLRKIGAQIRPFGVIDSLGEFSHVLVRRPGPSFAHLFGDAPAVMSTTIEMIQLP